MPEAIDYKCKTEIEVRNYEVDWQGIVHNATYLLYFEVGRLDYLRKAGMPLAINGTVQGSKIVLVRNEIDYKSSARFNERLSVYSRISSIKNTSFVFEGEIREVVTNRLIALNIAYHVWLDSQTNRPIRVPDDFRLAVKGFEG